MAEGDCVSLPLAREETLGRGVALVQGVAVRHKEALEDPVAMGEALGERVVLLLPLPLPLPLETTEGVLEWSNDSDAAALGEVTPLGDSVGLAQGEAEGEAVDRLCVAGAVAERHSVALPERDGVGLADAQGEALGAALVVEQREGLRVPLPLPQALGVVLLLREAHGEGLGDPEAPALPLPCRVRVGHCDGEVVPEAHALRVSLPAALALEEARSLNVGVTLPVTVAPGLAEAREGVAESEKVGVRAALGDAVEESDARDGVAAGPPVTVSEPQAVAEPLAAGALPVALALTEALRAASDGVTSKVAEEVMQLLEAMLALMVALPEGVSDCAPTPARKGSRAAAALKGSRGGAASARVPWQEATRRRREMLPRDRASVARCRAEPCEGCWGRWGVGALAGQVEGPSASRKTPQHTKKYKSLDIIKEQWTVGLVCRAGNEGSVEPWQEWGLLFSGTCRRRRGGQTSR